MIIDVLPVIPPELRPMVQLDGGRFATSDLNDLYRRVINRNNRLKRLHAAQRAGHHRPQRKAHAAGGGGRPHRQRPPRPRRHRRQQPRAQDLCPTCSRASRAASARTCSASVLTTPAVRVIVVGPELKMYQCGLPKEMAIELFTPVRHEEAGRGRRCQQHQIRQEDGGHVSSTEVWDALDVVIKEHPVLLNRAPTLHRLGIQAFEPVLVEGRALKLHPLACTAYNADFDGDQMAIHVPLSAEAQAEARILMLSANNLLRPQDGQPVTPSRRRIWSSAPTTSPMCARREGTGMAFSTPEEALMAYQAGAVTLHSPIKVRVTKTIDGVEKYKTVEATVGRIIFNEPIPQDLGFVDRTDPEHAFDLRGRLPRRQERSSARSSTAASRSTASPFPPRCSTASRRRATSISTRGAHDRLHRGHGRPRGEKGTDRTRPRRRSSRSKSSTGAVLSPTTSATAWSSTEWEQTTERRRQAPCMDNLRRVQPHLHDGDVRRPRLHQPDPSAGRYARPDGEHRR